MEELTQQAIQAALTRNWKEAISLNTKILKQNPKDTDALNRLGRAYFESGFKTKAELTYKKVLRIDKFNSIANKSLDLLHNSKITRGGTTKLVPSISQAMFLEEPGITRTVSLTRLGDPKIISSLHPGDPVLLHSRDHCVTVTTTKNLNLGRLPDDLASRLLVLIKNGNKYDAWIKSLDGVKIFIRETYRSTKNKNTPSFPITEKLTYAAFTPPELIHTEKPDVSAHEDLDQDFQREPGDVDIDDLVEIPQD